MDKQRNIRNNRRAWDEQVRKKNRWTIPVTPEQVAQARIGNWQVLLTPQVPVPAEWFPEMKGLKILALASAGGQQGQIWQPLVPMWWFLTIPVLNWNRI